MKALMAAVFVIAVAQLASSASAQRLLTLVKKEGAKPHRFIGYPLRAVDGFTVNSRGQESRAPENIADAGGADNTAGYACVGVGPGRSLRWKPTELPKQKVFLYFLLRTGHQRGYEYVSPTMTYVVTVDGQRIEMAPVYEVPAVRVFQSKDGWGHDMSWIRSKEKVALKPGSQITIGCVEKYAFVAQCLLVNETANALTRTIGEIEATQRRLSRSDELLARLAETFPGSKRSVETSKERLRAIRERVQRLSDDVDAAGKSVEAGQNVDAAGLARQARKVADDFSNAEKQIVKELRQTLMEPYVALQKRFRLKNGLTGRSYSSREALYSCGVAGQYLDEAKALFEQGQTGRSASPDKSQSGRHEADSLKAIQRVATYLWRADQFMAEAEEYAKKIPGDEPKLPEIKLAPGPSARGELLLNGEWEISTQGSPDTPPEDGWWKIRVPHGPWGETVGTFMALDRKWPAGQKWAWYRLKFPTPKEWEGGLLKLHFEAVFHLCEVYVNGVFCGRHIGGFDAFEVDITAAARVGEMNELLCFVHDTSRTALAKSKRGGEPTGCSSGPNHFIISDLWGRRFGGIWQSVSLVVRPSVYVSDVFVTSSYRKREITVKTWVTNETDRPVSVRVSQRVMDSGQPVLSLPKQMLKLGSGRTKQLEARRPWPQANLWGIGGKYGSPENLYFLQTQLTLDGENEPADAHYQRFGFREFWIQDGQFWLNGQRLPLQGGGTWYLQEGKAPHGNRWFALHFYRVERGMNVNIERWHRHGDVAREFFDVGDELGMLSEPEGPYWGCYGAPDILGYSDWDDPVWVRNVAEHYRRWARKHRNHPSIVIWSIENETFTSSQRPAGMLDRFISFGEAMKEEDPTRPVTYHGSANGGHADDEPRLEIVNLHYPPNNRVKNWREKWGNRPCINGEFQNYPALFKSSSPDPKEAAEYVERLSRWIESQWRYYREIELSGAMYFLPYMAGLFSTAKPEYMGPWSDLLPPIEGRAPIASGWRKGSVSVHATAPITWPSLSGPGIKCEQLITGTGNRSLINWFDPTRPEATPTPVYDALKRSWRPMPQLSPRKAPEVIVTVKKDGRAVAGAAVIAAPLDGQSASPIGVMTDPAGTAWLVFKEAGRYRLQCGAKAETFEAKWGRSDAPPGYDDVARFSLDIGAHE